MPRRRLAEHYADRGIAVCEQGEDVAGRVCG